MKIFIVCETGFEGLEKIEGAFFSRANANTFREDLNNETPKWKEYGIQEVDMMDGANSTDRTEYQPLDAGMYYPTD